MYVTKQEISKCRQIFSNKTKF